jgi:hypothetical protein
MKLRFDTCKTDNTDANISVKPKLKGMSLPLETVVLLILSAIVLAALLGFFLGAFTPSQTEADLTRQQVSVCQEIASAGCLGNPAETIATNKLVDKVCKPDRSACQKPSGLSTVETAKACIRSCCRIFCPV